MGTVSRVGESRSSKSRQDDKLKPGLRSVQQVHAGGRKRRVGT